MVVIVGVVMGVDGSPQYEWRWGWTGHHNRSGYEGGRVTIV